MAIIFEWDDAKGTYNGKKHNVSFYKAQEAFLDPHRIIAEDLEHSENEQRYYCFGKIDGGIMTVRFTYRDKKIRIIDAGYCARGKKYMKKKTPKYTTEKIGRIKVISDFLPSPENLVLKEETVKVTLSLTKGSIDFFKQEAKEYNTQYQKMIRTLLNEYTNRYKDHPSDHRNI